MAHMTNPLATVDQLYRRASFSAIPTDLQDLIFFTTQCLTQAAGILLRLPQSVTAQANVVLARYWLVESPLADEFSDVSAASLFLVAKLSAHPCPLRDICNVYAYLLSPSSALFRAGDASPAAAASSYQPPTEAAYADLHGRVLRLEGRILAALGFDTHVALPHALAVTYLQALDFLGRPRGEVARRAVAYLNAALLSPQLLYLTHQPPALAVAAIYNAARDCAAKMPECSWWEVFDVDREELGFLVVAMRSLEGWARRQREGPPEEEEEEAVEGERERERESGKGATAVARRGGHAYAGARRDGDAEEGPAVWRRRERWPAPAAAGDGGGSYDARDG